MSIMDEQTKNQLKKRTDRLMFLMYRDFPFWAFLVEKCKVQVVGDESGCSTACITKDGTISINASFYKNNSDAMMHFVLAHEVMHVMLCHFDRCKSRDPLLWNVSGDVLINHMLGKHFESKGVYLDLSKFCTADKFDIHIPDEYTTEMVYEDIYKNAKHVLVELEKMPTGMNGTDMQKNPGQGTVVRDRSEEFPQSEKEWEEAGLEAATRSRLAGNCPKFMDRMIDDMLQPKISWNQHLAYYLRQKFCMKGKSRHTFTPPNRRYLYQDVIMTSRVGQKKPCLAFSVDTSGSMTPEDLQLGVSEMDGIRKLYKVPLYLIECDTQVHNAKWVTPMEPIPHLKGGGGTSFVPVMDHLREKKPDVDVLIYFTDGYGDFGTDPGFDVIWVINNMHVTPPYGKVIRVEAGS